MHRRMMIVVSFLLLAGGSVLFLNRSTRAKRPAVTSILATQPTSAPTTRKAAKPKYPTYMELVHLQNPAVAATQPLDVPLDLPDSAHLIFHDPVYLDPIGNLWITRSDGMPTEKALQKPDETEDHVIQDRPVFVHWFTDDAGNWMADVVVKSAEGGFDLITKKDRTHLADDRHFHWTTGYSVASRFVVTTDTGVSVFDTQPKALEHYHLLPGSAKNAPVTLLDTRGVLAWAPWENGRTGSTGVSRFADGNWVNLPPADWPAKPIQLSMLLDGSVLRIAAGTEADADPNPDNIHLSIGKLESDLSPSTLLDEKHIGDLIDQLSDPDSDKRQAAFDELSRYGPSIAPLLEKSQADQLPEAKMRIRQLLRNKITPALGGFTPVDNRLDVVKRCADGTVIFFAPVGVQIPSENDEPEIINPAWLAMRGDGRMERPLPNALTRDQKPESPSIVSVRDEWIVKDDAGPRRLVGSVLQPLLLPEEKRFKDVVGLGTHHRWIFQDPSKIDLIDTLVIDPLVADPTPKLPTWPIVTFKGAAGWDAQDFPAVSRAEKNGNWELQEDGWKPLPPEQKVITELPATTQPTTVTSKGNLLLKGADGSEYFDGKSSIIMVKKTGEQIDWPLPATAVGIGDPVLMQTADGLLFLFNQAGRLLRIRSTPAGTEPFKLEAVFTRDIPDTDHPTRVWLDPAGRIDFIADGNVLVVTFPSGVIPKEISRMMLDGNQ